MTRSPRFLRVCDGGSLGGRGGVAVAHTYLQTLQTSVGREEQQEPQGDHEDVPQAPVHRAAGGATTTRGRPAPPGPRRRPQGTGVGLHPEGSLSAE